MAETSIAYTRDQMFRVDLVAFRTNLFIHRSIGATIRAYHWEVSGALWWRKERWVEAPVAFLTVRVLYEGLLVGGEPGTGTFVHGNLCANASSCDERLWAIGFSWSVNASADSGLPTFEDTSTGWGDVGPGTTLDVRGARAVGNATIGREILPLPEVSVGIVMTEGAF